MSEPGFKIANKEWAKREFPKRLLKVAAERHGYPLHDTFGLNQEIATKFDVDKSMVTRWLKGAVPRAATLLKIAEAYGVSPDWLVGNDTVPEGGFTLADVEAQLPFDTIQNVMRLMYEALDKMPESDRPGREAFGAACVEVLKLVVTHPDIPEYAIYGAAQRSLTHGPESIRKVAESANGA